MMVELDESYPCYGFARHKGYSTPEHMAALCAWGPCPEHRYSYTNVVQAKRRWATGWQDGPALAGGDVIDVTEPGPDSNETPDGWADLVSEEVTVGEARDAD
jgi:hypothetical protein